MSEINKHETDLVSLFPFAPDVWRDKMYFKYLIEELKTKANWLLITGRKPSEDISQIILETFNKKDIIYSDNNPYFFEFYLYINSDLLNQSVFDLICLIWETYEHPTVMFSKEIDPFLKIKPNKIINGSWKDVTLLSMSYILFKGIEDDVLWIGKSKDLEFPDFNSLL